MSDELIPLRLIVPPGVSTSDSPQASESRWIDSEKVRFHQGKPQKVGGWTKKNAVPTSGAPRSLMCWRANDASPYIIAGTYRKLYALDPEGSFSTNNITPLSSSGTLGANPFATTNGSAIITVTHVAHGRGVGDSVKFAGASTFNGVTIVGEYVVATVPGANSYTIVHSSNANATGSGGGAAVTYEYELPIGRITGGYGLGWGIGGYGTGTYGTARGFSNVIVEPRVWSFDHFGQIALTTFNTSSIYKWDPSVATPLAVRAAIIADAPTDTRALFVTPERFVVALCANRVVKWSDQGDHTTWTPAISNVAGQRTLTAAGSKFVTGRTCGGVSLIFSDYNVHIWQYVGGEFIWNSRLAGDNCGAISPNSVVSFAGNAFWMGRYGFYMYSGNVRPIPNQQDVHAYVFDNLDQLSAYLVGAFFNAKFNEIWFFFANQSGAEPSMYVICDLDSFSWAVGHLERVGGHHFPDGETRPYWANSSGSIFLHEDGNDDDGAAMDAFVTLSPASLDKAKRIMDIEGIETDFFEQSGLVEITVNTYDRLKSLTDTPMETVTEQISESQTMLDLRLAGRYAGLTVRSNSLGGFFRFGAPAVYIKDSGVRR